MKPSLPDARSGSESARFDTKRPTVREIHEHIDSHSCYVRIGSELIRIRHIREVQGQLQGKSLNRPGEWITIPADASFELRD